MKKIILLVLAIISITSCTPIYKKMNIDKDFYNGLQDGVYAKMETSKGELIIKFFDKDAPVTVANFVGLAEGTIENKKGVNKIIQLINEETQKVVLEERTKIKYSFKKVKPASYIIRIIDDVNNNGRWDMGDLEKNQIAEMVSVFNTIIKIKSNFEIVQNIKEE